MAKSSKYSAQDSVAAAEDTAADVAIKCLKSRIKNYGKNNTSAVVLKAKVIIVIVMHQIAVTTKSFQ